MEFYWTIKEGNDRVAVFALGWAADHRVMEHIRPHGWDILTVYDYGENIGSPVGTTAELAAYEVKCLFGWSFGVWAAEQIFGDTAFDSAVALNGTPYPVNDLFGIERRRMAVTIRGLRSGGMEAFNERAYGEHYERFRTMLPPRPLDRNIAELEFLSASSQETYGPTICWDKAIVGSEDKIFPPENMVRFWGSCAEILPLPHYPFADPQLIYDELGNR